MKPPYYTRFIILMVVCGVMGLGILVQIIRLQTSPSAQVLLLAAKNYEGVTQVIIPERGSIYDRYGHLLAGNETTYEIALDLAAVVDPETIATTASSHLGMDYFEVLGKAQLKAGQDGLYYIILKNFVSSDTIEQISILKEELQNRPVKRGEANPSLDGLVWVPHLKRSYPEGKLASNVIGFYNYLDREGGHGFYGVEESYNGMLAGSSQEVFYAYDPNKAQALPDIPPGASLILTIDRQVQATIEQILDDSVKTSGAKAGTIIVSDPKTGEILGMATTPRLNPNEYWEYQEVFPSPTPYNRAVGATYEPGSVFKIITMAAGLDAGVVTRDTIYNDYSGTFIWGGGYIYNWDGGAWGEQDMTGCMRHSLNVCLSWVASELGEADFYKYVKAFGFDRITGVDMAGELRWPLRQPGDEQWYEIDLATNAFGQGIAVTPMQMVMAVSAVANEGKMMAPHVVKAVIDNGRQYEINPVIVGAPISAETAKTLTSILVDSLKGETGYDDSAAIVEGYNLAGKTGTGSIPTELGYTLERTNTSFVGWGPAEDPQFLVYIWLEEPTSSIWSSEVVAPIFNEVVSQLVVLLNIPPSSTNWAAME